MANVKSYKIVVVDIAVMVMFFNASTIYSIVQKLVLGV